MNNSKVGIKRHIHTHTDSTPMQAVEAQLTRPLNRGLWLLSFLLLHLGLLFFFFFFLMQSVNVNNDLGKSKNKEESIGTCRARSHPPVVERQARKVTIPVSHQLHTRAENQCTSLCRNMKTLRLYLILSHPYIHQPLLRHTVSSG